jgi:4-diphosphocytidyl-2-C-methyl-D-erythritol kinase
VTTRAVIKSFAKVNLFLDVVCKRPDGYHNIETIFQTVSLADIMEIELTSAGIEISCNNPEIPTDENNLAYKAAFRLSEAAGYTGGVRIRIEKSIPAGAGLGGGSSNAAATLVWLNHLLRAGLSENELRAIAQTLGADVPFFISGGLAAAWQIGDKIQQLPPLERHFLILAVPKGITVSTREAYSMVSVPECGDAMPNELSECSDRLRAWVAALTAQRAPFPVGNAAVMLHNSLEKPVFSRYPEIANLKTLLLREGAQGALMSGSGSAVFGLGESLAHARNLGCSLKESVPCDCSVHNSVNRGSVMETET